jgi:hypothetical protein
MDWEIRRSKTWPNGSGTDWNLNVLVSARLWCTKHPPRGAFTEVGRSREVTMISASNWLTLVASLVALLSVVMSYRMGKKQIANAHDLALRQIDAAAKESARRLKADVVLKDKQSWIKEFRETINDILYLADPFLTAHWSCQRASVSNS